MKGPDTKWRADVLSQGQVISGDVSFPVAPFDPPSHDALVEHSIQIWLKIRGLPLMFWLYVEFRRLAEELGGFLVHVDPRSSGHHDLTVLRMKIGVPKVDVVPKFRRLHFVGDNKNHKYYDLLIDIESSSHDRCTSPPRQYCQKKTGEEVSGLEEAVDKEDSIVNKLVIGETNLNASTSNQSGVRDKNSFSVLSEIGTFEELYIETWDPRTDLAVENNNKEETGNEGDKKNKKTMCDQLKVMEKPPLPPEQRHSARLKRKDPIVKEGTVRSTKLKESVLTHSGTDYLVEVFYFSHFSDIELVQLMESSGFSLGSVLEDISYY